MNFYRMHNLSQNFLLAIKTVGIKYAIKKSISYILTNLFKNNKLVASPIKYSCPPKHQNFKINPTPIIKSILIISDTAIEQCLLYRVFQKQLMLKNLGYGSMHLKSSQTSKIQSFLNLVSYVIIYRTHIENGLMKILKASNAKIFFEIDDMSLGQKQLSASQILNTLSENEQNSLKIESDAFYATASECDALIVSTHALQRNCKNETLSGNISKKEVLTIPNFMTKSPSTASDDKKYDFAFTSPSLSVGPEINMFIKAVSKYYNGTKKTRSILLFGNKKAQDKLYAAGFLTHEVTHCPRMRYSEYLEKLRYVKFVLIPLEDNLFNQSKTAVRGMDAVISGAIPIASKVGQYFELQQADPNLEAIAENWDDAPSKIKQLEEEWDCSLKRIRKSYAKLFSFDKVKNDYIKELSLEVS